MPSFKYTLITLEGEQKYTFYPLINKNGANGLIVEVKGKRTPKISIATFDNPEGMLKINEERLLS